MKKIPNHMDNPIDNILIDICENLCEFFNKTGHTPNILTTYSLFTGLISCYFLNNRKLLLFSVFYLLSYFFDCADGHYARKYKMTTKFGDMYDHIKDSFILLLVLIISYKNASHNITKPMIFILILFTGLSLFHFSCQENNCDVEFKDKDNDTFKPVMCLCSNRNHIYWSRYFGAGTFVMIFISLVCYINR